MIGDSEMGVTGAAAGSDAAGIASQTQPLTSAESSSSTANPALAALSGVGS